MKASPTANEQATSGAGNAKAVVGAAHGERERHRRRVVDNSDGNGDHHALVGVDSPGAS